MRVFDESSWVNLIDCAIPSPTLRSERFYRLLFRCPKSVWCDSMWPSMAILMAGDKMFISADVDDTQNGKGKGHDIQVFITERLNDLRSCVHTI